MTSNKFQTVSFVSVNPGGKSAIRELNEKTRTPNYRYMTDCEKEFVLSVFHRKFPDVVVDESDIAIVQNSTGVSTSVSFNIYPIDGAPALTFFGRSTCNDETDYPQHVENISAFLRKEASRKWEKRELFETVNGEIVSNRTLQAGEKFKKYINRRNRALDAYVRENLNSHLTARLAWLGFKVAVSNAFRGPVFSYE